MGLNSDMSGLAIHAHAQDSRFASQRGLPGNVLSAPCNYVSARCCMTASWMRADHC